MNVNDKRASGDAVDELHALVTEMIVKEIKAAHSRTACEICKQVPGIPPALLGQAIKFLKDNGVDMPAQTGNRVDTLKDAMPDFDEVERGTRLSPTH